MKFRIIAIITTILLNVAGSSVSAQSSFEITSQFSQIVLRGAFRAELIPSESCSAVVTIYGAEQNKVDWSVKNGKLNVSLRVGLIDRDCYADIKIYYKDLSYIGVEGVTLKNSEALLGTNLKLETLGGVNKIQLGVNLANLDLTASGNSNIVLRGSIQEADIKAYIGAKVDCMQCEIDDIYATVNQGSEMYVRTSGRLDAKVSTAGNLYYMGNPKLRTKSSLGGAVIMIGSPESFSGEQIPPTHQEQESETDSTGSYSE